MRGSLKISFEYRLLSEQIRMISVWIISLLMRGQYEDCSLFNVHCSILPPPLGKAGKRNNIFCKSMFECLYPWNRYRCKLITISDLWGRTLQFRIENLIWPVWPGSDQAVYLQMWNVDILQSLLSGGRGISLELRTYWSNHLFSQECSSKKKQDKEFCAPTVWLSMCCSNNAKNPKNALRMI